MNLLAQARPGDAASPGRQYLTLLFSDLSRSTELAEVMEAEEYAELLDSLRAAYQQAVVGAGGQIVRVQGDGLLAMFGYPVTREDDGRRAVEAALRLHEAVRLNTSRLPPGFALSLHTGVHCGMVLVGAGDIERGRFELLGPVPNIAARLSDQARPHEVLVSEETLGPARRHFNTGAPEMLRLKGRTEPLLVYRVDARADAAARLHSGARRQLGFVGRETELQRLAQALHQAQAGRPCAMAVQGTAGVGKTRLVEEFLRRAQALGWQVLRGACEGEFGAEPLQPFRQMLQSLGQSDMPATLQAWAEQLAGLASVQPTLLFVDDWQWADDASQQVLAALAAESVAPILLLLTCRSSPTAPPLPPGVGMLELAPLNEAQSAQAVAQHLPGGDPFVAANICARAGGNPLFIEVLCQSVARTGDGRLAPASSTAGWLNQLVGSLVQAMPAEQAALVRMASVVGNGVPAGLLQRLSGLDKAEELAQRLAGQDMLLAGERAGTLRFRHGVVRDVIYTSVGLAERQALHLRIAAAIQQHGTGDDGASHQALEALAHHFAAGADMAQAAHYAEAAGDRALAASALDRAVTQYNAALAALDALQPQGLTEPHARRWVAIVCRIAMVRMFDPSRGQVALCERALRLAEALGDAGLQARARHWLGCVHYALGDAPAAIRHGEQARAQAERLGAQALAVQAVAALGHARTAAAQYEPALALLDEAIAAKRNGLARGAPVRTDSGLSYALVCRGVALGDRGRFDEAERCFDEALACVVERPHPNAAGVQGWRAAVRLWRGHWQAAAQAADDSARIAQATHSLWQLSIARAIGGHARWMLSGDTAALDDIATATRWLEPRDSGLFRSFVHGWLAEGLVANGRHADARHQAALALQRGRSRDLIGVAMAYRAMARSAAAQGRMAAAARYLQHAYRVARERGSPHEHACTELCEAQLVLQHGLAGNAHGLLGAASRAFEAMGMSWHLAQAQRCAGQAPMPQA